MMQRHAAKKAKVFCFFFSKKKCFSGFVWSSLAVLAGACAVHAIDAQGAPLSRSDPGINILKLLPQASSETDYTAVINSAAATGKTLYLPNTGRPYVVSNALRFPAAGAGLIGQPGTTIAFTDSSTIFGITAPDITFQNITFDGSRLGGGKRGEAYCLRPNFRWIGGGMYYGGPTFIQQGCDNAFISKVKFSFDESTAFTVQAQNVTISDSEFENNAGFGINAAKGATNFNFSGNWTNGNALELIGISHGASGGTLENNRAIGTGDNCYSISGDRVRVINNIARRCLGHGIGVYGSQNTLSGNIVQDNGQDDNPDARPIKLWNGGVKEVYHSPGYSPHTYDGIKVVAGSGGAAAQNTIANNKVMDDQATPTQGGIEIVRAGPGNNATGNAVGRVR